MRAIRFGASAISVLVVAMAACSSGSPPAVEGPVQVGATSSSSGSSASSGSGGGGGGPQSGGCSVTAQGVVASDGNATTSSVAWNGDTLGMIWANEAGDEIVAALFDGSGKRTASTSVAKGISLKEPVLYADKGGYIAAWTAGGVVMTQHLDAGAKPTGIPLQIAVTGGTEAHPKGAPAATGLLLGWDNGTAGALALVTDNGAGVPVDVEGHPTFPAPSYDGTSAGLFWSDGANLAFAAVTSPLALGTKKTIPATATNKGALVLGSTHYVTWEDDGQGDGNERVFVASAGPDQAFSTPVAVPTESGSANWPAIAAIGGDIAVAYYQFRSGPPSVFLALFHPDLGRNGAELQVSPDGEQDRFPSLAVSGKRIALGYTQKTGPVKLSLVECH